MRNRLYYLIKPMFSPSFRMGVRRWFALRKRERVREVWPILHGSERPPAGWPGWPEGKQFALVLTHDVEGPSGLAKCRQLMELEMELGFRSSFNFVPEGTYRVPRELREELTRNGFEIGVHDLHHDGKLYRNPQDFAKKSARINQYLKDWGATGFRSGFMLRNLDWLHKLDIQYEASTFDTDPFEPQPEGAGTIFPFFVPHPNSEPGALNSEHSVRIAHHASRPGYVELPYTLPQDSTLFLLLRETTPRIWLQKLDWVAQHGGMALVNVHPDYLQFPGEPLLPRTFPVKHYRDLLENVIRRHADAWRPLPRDLAGFVLRHEGLRKPSALQLESRSAMKSPPSAKKIWIDLDNTPHVPFFKPMIRELKARGSEVLITARDAFQVCDLADKFGISYQKFGHHHGKHMLAKIWGVVARAVQLAPTVIRNKPILALNHGSRAQTLLSNILGIPTVTIMDYEHAGKKKWLRSPRLLASRYSIIPDCVPPAAFSGPGRTVLQYRGIKEDVYAPEFCPDSTLLTELGIPDSVIVATVRPPADEAHYHNHESDVMFAIAMEFLLKHADVWIVLLPRKKSQEKVIRERYPAWFSSGRVVVPLRAIDGMNLLWFSDLVISGGGTMNREAAALGVPVYSVFRGVMGAVDRRLVEQARLVMLANKNEVAEQVIVRKRDRTASADSRPRHAMGDILHHLEDIVATEMGNRRK